MSEKWEITHNENNNSATVQFVSVDKEIIIALRNLSKKALRAGGKVIRNKLKASGEISQNMRNHIAAAADIDRANGTPQLKIGFYGWRKVASKGKTPSKRNPWWQEFGTKPHQIARKDNGKILGSNSLFFFSPVQNPGFSAQHTLRNIVYDNINEIRAAQEPFLEQLNGEIDAALTKEDYTEEVDDE